MQEYFWSIVIEEDSIQAAIWTIREKTAELIDVSNSSSWEDDEVLVTAADACLSSCIQKLPEDASEPTKTVFGVPSSWVTDGQIEKQYLDKIRLICNKLSLTPTGFVVLSEAIAHFKKATEKTPLSAVLVGVYPQSIDISVFRLGNVSGNVKVARSTNITDDIVEGFARFGEQEPFPSRFILYDSKLKSLEDAKQDLIKADWEQLSGNVKFLHTPQVEILESNDKMAAVCLAGAAEISQANDIAFRVKDEAQVENSSSPVVPIEAELVEGVVAAETMGFTSNLDLPEASGYDQQNTTQTQEKQFEKPGRKFNFKMPALSLPHFGNFKFKLGSENMLFIGAIVLLVLIVAGFSAWWFVPKAQVTIFITPQKIDTHEKVVYDQNANGVDVSKRIVPAKLQSTTVNADKTKTTSGTKTVGTPSKGSVTFYNAQDEITIPSGTVVKTATLQFTVDGDIKIASASGVAQPATATGNITSSGVGADYNLASGTFFTVGNYSTSTIQAKNDADLSGGSSQEVAATSKDDVTSLTNDLTKELLTKGENNLKDGLDAGSLFLENTLTTTQTSKKVDHDVGEEATTVKLSLAAKVTGLTVARSDMASLARQLYSSQIPSGFSMKDDQIDFITNSKDTNFIINLLPTIDPQKLADQIAGKNIEDAKKILSKVPGYSDVDIEVTPRFLNLPFLPHIANNISVILSAK